MPSFLHTLIGLGPFADQGCTIVFTTTSVTVYHPHGLPVLAGWREQTGSRLWHFLLTKQGATPPAAASITTSLETILSPPLQAQPPSIGTLRPMPARSLTLPPAPPHPSQGILATSSAGVACAVYYVYGAAQAVTLASRATGTAFDLQSLDLPSIGGSVGFYHACLGFLSSKPPSKPATVTPSKASHTPMPPNIARIQMKRSWAILSNNAKTSGRQNPSSQ
jgi:hypothetical protein